MELKRNVPSMGAPQQTLKFSKLYVGTCSLDRATTNLSVALSCARFLHEEVQEHIFWGKMRRDKTMRCIVTHVCPYSCVFSCGPRTATGADTDVCYQAGNSRIARLHRLVVIIIIILNKPTRETVFASRERM